MKVKEYLELATLKMEMECNKAEYTYLSSLGKDGYYGEYTEGIVFNAVILTAIIAYAKEIVHWIVEFFKHPIEVLTQAINKLRSLNPSKFSMNIEIYDINAEEVRNLMIAVDKTINDPSDYVDWDGFTTQPDLVKIRLFKVVDYLRGFDRIVKDLQSTIDRYEKAAKQIDSKDKLLQTKYEEGVKLFTNRIKYFKENISIINKALW